MIYYIQYQDGIPNVRTPFVRKKHRTLHQITSKYGAVRRIITMRNDAETVTLRVFGESDLSRTNEDIDGKIIMYDFDGGPCYKMGDRITDLHYNGVIIDITPVVGLAWKYNEVGVDIVLKKDDMNAHMQLVSGEVDV